MVTLIITLATDSISWEEARPLLQGGLLVHAVGVLNLRWEDFSALDFAREARLQELEWETLKDDTPGSVTLTILYGILTRREIEARVQQLQEAVDDYDCTETVDRQTAVIDV